MGSDQKRAFIAVFLSGAVLVLWQMFFAPQPELVNNQIVNEKVVQPNVVVTPAMVEAKKKVTKSEPSVGLTTVKLNNINHQLTFNNQLEVVDYVSSNTEGKKEEFSFANIVGSESPFKIQVIDQGIVKTLNFSLKENDSHMSLTGIDSVEGVTLQVIINDNGRVSFSLNSDKPRHFRVVFKSTEKTLENTQIRQFIYFGQDVDRTTVSSDDAGEEKLKWYGIDFNFHIFAFILKDKILSKFNISETGVMTVDTVRVSNHFSGDLVFAKKNYDQLAKLGDKLDLSVDFGIFGIVAVPILRGLQFIYKYVNNYGLAIIILTFGVRFVLFPLQLKSFRSMKKMQQVQPELKALKEKFKDDPQRMQQETMALFKRAGTNPMSGCLPLIAQMPIFIAFYQVLYNSVELVNAPFYFWVQDLSVKDPFYVLPVLMGLSFFFQSKLNPTATADPMQQKLMTFMPVIFAFFMKDLPAGLTLYMVISAVVGIMLQLLVYKLSD
jgi:YidC/Oxa1 family membrane protein insertase